MGDRPGGLEMSRVDRAAQVDEVRMTEPESHTFADLRRIDEKLDRIGGRMDGVETRLHQIADELLVLKRHRPAPGGREIETTGLKAMLDRHERWLGELGRHVAELEDSPKDQASYGQVVRF